MIPEFAPVCLPPCALEIGRPRRGDYEGREGREASQATRASSSFASFARFVVSSCCKNRGVAPLGILTTENTEGTEAIQGSLLVGCLLSVFPVSSVVLKYQTEPLPTHPLRETRPSCYLRGVSFILAVARRCLSSASEVRRSARNHTFPEAPRNRMQATLLLTVRE